MTRTDLTTTVEGDEVAAWHFEGQGDALAGPAGRPCVVMGHGLGATRDSGLEPYAEAFSAAGMDVLLFDYRRLGASGGEPRQLVVPADQRADFHAMVARARSLEGVDPDRVVVWGCSMAGGHVLQVGAEDERLAAVVAVTPAADGLAALLAALRREGPLFGLKLTVAGLRDQLGALRGKPAVTVPIVGAPGSVAVLTAPGAEEALPEVAGPTWRNEVAARIGLVLGLYRPGRHAARIKAPVLVHVADEDQSVPARAQVKAAKRARAEVRHLPCDHFDVYAGRSQVERAIEHQLHFLRRHLAVPAPVVA